MSQIQVYPDLSLENMYWKNNYLVVGIDEVGRGAVAGPLVLGATIIKPGLSKLLIKNLLELGIRDSKLLSRKKREHININISPYLAYSVIKQLEAEYINKYGIVKTLVKGINDIIDDVNLAFPKKKICFLIDGLPLRDIPCSNTNITKYIVKGDNKSVSIAIASVQAKVTRDGMMSELAGKEDLYLWKHNMGYGTEGHRSAVGIYGLHPEHRALYVSTWLSH